MKNPSQKMTKPSQNFGLHFLPFFLQFTHCPDRNVQSCVFLNLSRKMLQSPDLSPPPLPPPPPLSLLSIRHAPCLSCAFSFFKPEPSSFLTLIPVVSSSRNEAIPFRISKAPTYPDKGVHEVLTTFELASSKPKRSTRINPLSKVRLPLYCQSVMEDCCLAPCLKIVHEDSTSIELASAKPKAYTRINPLYQFEACLSIILDIRTWVGFLNNIFLQGPEIDEAIVQKIRDAIREGTKMDCRIQRQLRRMKNLMNSIIAKHKIMVSTMSFLGRLMPLLKEKPGYYRGFRRYPMPTKKGSRECNEAWVELLATIEQIG
ncbi:hypothetical protein Cgig2_030963 [Carnegiea gigantea]|uniref:Uncharacterized protein n=1 Tax=Carnegiea gigantea TaxID=171969 RepID=A0A9Q1K3B4_9CARY|nr:hypothetical protein Cgig2_030963 [Carnegiea gigantea]